MGCKRCIWLVHRGCTSTLQILHRVYNQNKKEIIAQTVTFFPHNITVLPPGGHNEDSTPLTSHRYPLRSHICCSTRNYETEHAHTPLTNAVVDTHTGNMLEYRHFVVGPNKRIQIQSLANDLGRLAQEVGTCMLKGTNTIFFFRLSDIPNNRKIS